MNSRFAVYVQRVEDCYQTNWTIKEAQVQNRCMLIKAPTLMESY